MGLGERKHRRKRRRHLRRDHRVRGSQQAGHRTIISRRLASTVYAALLIVAIVLVSFGFPLVLLGVVFMFEGMTYHPSEPGVICMVMGAVGVCLGMLICRYTHKRAHRVSQNKVGVAIKPNTHIPTTGTPKDREDPNRPHGDPPATSMSWSELSVGSQDSSYAGQFGPESIRKLHQVITVQSPRLHGPMHGLVTIPASQPPKPPDNYTVPPLSATPAIKYKGPEGHGLPSMTKTSETSAGASNVWTVSTTSHEMN